ncbi:MAG: hypothetical protein ACRD0G_13900 [Acidimicrobiales bacterium]
MQAERFDVRQAMRVCEVRLDDELMVVLASDDPASPILEVRFRTTDEDATGRHHAQLLDWWVRGAQVTYVRTGGEVALVDEDSLLRHALA